MVLTRRWKLQILLNAVLVLTILLHVGVPADGHDEEHLVCCHAGQQNCSILLATQTPAVYLQEAFTCPIELFSYQPHFVILQDPPPKTEWL